jgi:prepilin-type N-terminal cleavage/methylation domain-containing protein
MRKLALKSDGFTLIEVILIIVVVSIFMSAIGIPLLNSTGRAGTPDHWLH